MRKRIYDRLDFFLAAVIILAVFALGFSYIDNSCRWGDDFAAYISEGIAIADGTLDEQTRINAIMHPSPLTGDAAETEHLVYVWGYPLLLALVYRFVGFDKVGFSTVWCYKLPSVVALALLAGALYLLFRRRFGKKTAFFVAVFFCTYAGFYDFLDSLYSDMVFMSCFFVSVLLLEIFIDSEQRKQRLIFGCLLGLSMWYTYEVRLNGFAVLIVALLAHMGWLYKHHNSIYDNSTRRVNAKGVLTELVPYLVFLAVLGISSAFLPSATSSDDLTLSEFFYNIAFYAEQVCSWLSKLFICPAIYVLGRIVGIFGFEIPLSWFEQLDKYLGTVLALLMFVGITKEELKKNYHLFCLMIGYLLAVSCLPYRQGLRYIYPLLPLVLMRLTYMTHTLFATKLNRRLNPLVSLILCAMLSYAVAYPIISIDKKLTWSPKEWNITITSNMYDVYSGAAIETYNYISQNTPEDALIGFVKPRALQLNTGRTAVWIGMNGHTVDEVDYYLYYTNGELVEGREIDVISAYMDEFEAVFTNDEFTLYKRIAR